MRGCRLLEVPELCHDRPIFKAPSSIKVEDMSASPEGESLRFEKACYCPVFGSMSRDPESKILPMTRSSGGPVAIRMGSKKGNIDGKLEAETWRKGYIRLVCLTWFPVIMKCREGSIEGLCPILI